MRRANWAAAATLCAGVLAGCSGGGGVVSSRQEAQQPAAIMNNASMPPRMSTPAALGTDRQVRLPGVRDVVLRGGYAFAITADSLVVVDVAKPATPELVARLALPRSPLRLVLDGDTAYVACGAGGLAIVQVAKPKEPALRVTYAPQSGGVDRVAALGGLVLAGLGPNGLAVLDARGTGAPVERKLLPAPKNAREVALRGDRGYVLTDRVTVLTLAKPDAANALGTYHINSGIQNFGFFGDSLLTWGAGGLGLVDLTSVDRPVNGPELTNADLLKAWPPAPAEPKPAAATPAALATAPEPPLQREDRLRLVGARALFSHQDGTLGVVDLTKDKPPVTEFQLTKLDGPGAFDLADNLLVLGTVGGDLQLYVRGEKGFALTGSLSLAAAPSAAPAPAGPATVKS